jgi:desulfoferrodoxin-like iron-binding protein
MEKFPERVPPEWELGEWEKVLTIHVGAAYVCRACGNVAMVTRGGVGIMELICCGQPMDKAGPREGGGEE